MSYTRKTKGDKILIQGGYIPKGYDCLCKECKFTIEVPSCADDYEVQKLVKFIEDFIKR